MVWKSLVLVAAKRNEDITKRAKAGAMPLSWQCYDCAFCELERADYVRCLQKGKNERVPSGTIKSPATGLQNKHNAYTSCERD